MLSASAFGLSSRDPQVESLLAALDAARLNAEEAGDYMQAEACRRQLTEIDGIDGTRHVDALAAEQLAQRLGMDEAHVVEVSQVRLASVRILNPRGRRGKWVWGGDSGCAATAGAAIRVLFAPNARGARRAQPCQPASRLRARAAPCFQLGAFWDHRLFEFDEKARLLVEEMEARHAAEVRAFADQLDVPQRATGNVALIDLRCKEATLVKTLQYARAARVKAQADALEASVLEKLYAPHGLAAPGVGVWRSAATGSLTYPPSL
jgi:hypothetical protein